MAHNRFQTANNHTGANGGRVSNAPTDQRRWTASSSAIGAAKTRPSRSTRSRQTGAGMIFESARAQATTVVEVHPWKVSIITDEEEKKAKITKGRIIDGLRRYVEIEPTLTEEIIQNGDLVCLEFTYSDESIKSIIVPSATYEPFTDDGATFPTLLTSVQAIAKIVEEDDVLKVEQYCRNNFALTQACINGENLVQFSPL